MKKLALILLILVSVTSKAQLISLVVRNDTLFGVDPLTGTYNQYTKLISTPAGQTNKVVSSNGSAFAWTDIKTINSTSLIGSGNISISGGADSTTYYTVYRSDTSRTALYNAINTKLATTTAASTYAPINNASFTGTFSAPAGTITNSMLAGSIAQSNITNYAGYTINVQALTSSPTDAQTIYFGTLPKAPVTAARTSKIYIRQAGTITGAELYCYSGTAGTNENWSIYIRLNNTTDYLIATVGASANERVFSNTSLSISVNSGDYIEVKSVNPTWATNPLTTIFGGYIRIN